jgi:hypothetical protein
MRYAVRIASVRTLLAGKALVTGVRRLFVFMYKVGFIFLHGENNFQDLVNSLKSFSIVKFVGCFVFQGDLRECMERQDSFDLILDGLEFEGFDEIAGALVRRCGKPSHTIPKNGDLCTKCSYG